MKSIETSRIPQKQRKVFSCVVLWLQDVSLVIVAQPKRNLNTSNLSSSTHTNQPSLSSTSPSSSLRHPQLQHPHSQFPSFLLLERPSLHLSRWLTRYVMSSVERANSCAAPCHSISYLPSLVIRPNADHSLHYSVRGMQYARTNILRA
jgi:hypothetical protein